MNSNYYIYVINLKTSVKRYNKIKYQLLDNGLEENKDFEFVTAINGREAIFDDKYNRLLEDGVYEQIISDERGEHEDLSKGAFGCYLSHMKIWNIILKRKDFHLKRIPIILEDDVFIVKDFLNKVDTLMKLITKKKVDWDILNICPLSYNIFKEIIPKNDENEFKVFIPYRFFTTPALVLNVKNLEKIRKFMYPIRFQIDSHFSFQKNNIKCLLIEPSILFLSSNASKSTIVHKPPIGRGKLYQILTKKFPEKNFELFFKYKNSQYKKIKISEQKNNNNNNQDENLIDFTYNTTNDENNTKQTNIAFIVFSVITYIFFLALFIFYLTRCVSNNNQKK